MREYVRVPIDLFVLKEDIESMENGEEANGFIEVSNSELYQLVDKHSLQPAIQIDDNTFNIVFIMK
ncbi:MAG: hypothetical protein WD512_02010 [Candidatus Paceibacterota bacterium]